MGAVEPGEVEGRGGETGRKGRRAVEEEVERRRRGKSRGGGWGERAASTPASPRRKWSPAKRTGAPPPKKFSGSVRAALEASFESNRFPSHDEMASLGGSIGLTDHQVKVWFQNRRRPKKPRSAEQNGTPAKSS